MEPIELTDIQRLVIQGYPALRAAKYALLEVRDPAVAREWLGGLTRWVGTADRASRDAERPRPDGHRPPLERRLCIAFTWAGLKRLGFPEGYSDSAGFVGEFREGMVAPHRSLILGDVDQSAPSLWRWGSPGDSIHVLLIVYSESQDTLGGDWSEVMGGLRGVDLWRPARAPDFQNPMLGYLNPDNTEHFGFRDGISQPYIDGIDTRMRPTGRHAAGATVAPGEFILGYRNEVGALPASPAVPKQVDPQGILPVHPEDPEGSRDFGRNGSYLVLRQIEQDVKGFHEFVSSRAPGDEEHFAARLVGRWKCGKPLVEAPDANDFGYYAEDRYGFRCPVGSHIRRVNPRDAFADPSMGLSPEEAQGVVNRHRLIRRARLYGEQGSDARGERGLLFLCLNANLQRQFEFVQQHWINGPKFGGLDDEVDPIAGAHPSGKNRITIQMRPRSHTIEGIPRFVTVRGGAYFFLPGRKALEFLAALEPAQWPEAARRERRIPRFRPSRLFPAADLQTLANQLRRAPDLDLLSHHHWQIEFPMRDQTGDVLLGAFHKPSRWGRRRPLVVLIHGLPGSQESEVVLHSAAYFLRRGHPVLRLNQRGADPSQRKTRGIYHAGRSDDLREVIRKLREDFRGTGIVLVAYSLGANVMLKMLGEDGPLDPVRAAVSVSAPIDLRATATHLHRLQGWRRWLYVRGLLHLTKRCARAILGLDARQLEAIASARSFYEFDESFLAPFNDFASANDYYDRSSSAAWLGSIHVPTLLIHAGDDPMVPLAPYRAVAWAANDKLHPLLTASGGHAGFHQRGSPEAWHDRCAALFFDR